MVDEGNEQILSEGRRPVRAELAADVYAQMSIFNQLQNDIVDLDQLTEKITMTVSVAITSFYRSTIEKRGCTKRLSRT